MERILFESNALIAGNNSRGVPCEVFAMVRRWLQQLKNASEVFIDAVTLCRILSRKYKSAADAGRWHVTDGAAPEKIITSG